MSGRLSAGAKGLRIFALPSRERGERTICEANCVVSPQSSVHNRPRLGAVTAVADHMRYAILRTQKLKSGAAVRRSLLHAFREQETPNADPERTVENTHIGATSVADALDRFNARLATQPRIRKNAVLAIEYLVTASPEYLHGKTREQQDAYFRDALAWLQERHGEANIIYAGIHRDETTPHLYAYAVPLDRRGKLNCRAFLGGAEALRAMQTAFAEHVAATHGLERGVEGSRAHHQNIKRFYGRLGTMADDPRLKHIQMRKLEPVPPEPGLLDKLNGTAEPMKEARARALTKRQRDDEYNRQAAEHNRHRTKLLERLAGRGLANQANQQERAALVREANAQKTRADQADRSLEIVGRRARERKEEIEKLKDERTDHQRLVQMLTNELAAASPRRARELGLMEPEKKTEPHLQPTQDNCPTPNP